MAYQVDKFNGTFLVSVEDGTIDTTTDLRFVGKNYAGYGEVQNENFLHLLESFANSSAPPKAIAGQIWFDSSEKRLKFYDGSRFRSAVGAESSASAPAGLTKGDLWFDESAEQLYAYNGSEFILVGPENAPDIGTSTIVAQTVIDTLGSNHSIAKIVSGGTTIAVVSKDAFTLNNSLNAITGFDTIKKGVTLVNTIASTTGITSTDHYFWGTASNSLKFAGRDVDEFVRIGNTVLPQETRFTDGGYSVGDENDLRVYIDLGNEVAFKTTSDGRLIKFQITTDVGINTVLAITPTTVSPGVNNSYTLGSTSSKWLNVYSTQFTGNVQGSLLASDSTVLINHSTKTFNGDVLSPVDGSTVLNSSDKIYYGTVGIPSAPVSAYANVIGSLTGTADNASQLAGYLPSDENDPSTVVLRDTSGNISATRLTGISDKSDQLLVGASYFDAVTTPTADTIAARDSSGNLRANVFDGVATSARYADLAEKYLADKEYETGTVVMVGGDAEVTECQQGSRAIGAVSANPAFMMNNDLEGGTYIALKGRVPVKVTGSVKKGSRLCAGPNGTAVESEISGDLNIFAIALEASNEPGVKLIESIIL